MAGEGEGLIGENESKAIVLSITLDGSGIKVDGPIRNEMLCVYLLDKAKDIVKISNMQQGSTTIHRPGHGIIDFIRRGKK
jgi:hypothetical protein